MAKAKTLKKAIYWLLFLYLILFPFGQVLRLEPFYQVALHPVDVLAGLAGFIWLVGWILNRSPTPPLARPFLSFFAVALFSLILNSYRFEAREAVVGSLYSLRFLAYILFYFAVWELVRERRDLGRKLYGGLVGIGGFIALFGWFQYFVFPDIRPLTEFGWDDHYLRLVGSFLDPGFTGILLVIFTLLLLAILSDRGLFSRKWGRREKGTPFRQGLVWPAGLFLLGFSALAFTYSRASYLAFLAGLTALYIVRRNIKLVSGGALALVAAVLLLPRPPSEGAALGRTASVEARAESSQKALLVASENPLFGIGFNLYRYEQLKRGFIRPETGRDFSHAGAGTDNSFLFVFATAGVLGLISYLWLWGGILKHSWDRRRTVGGSVLFVSSSAILVHGLFNNTMFYPWVLGWMMLLLALQSPTASKKR